MLKGGIADKLGNRYEAKWLVRQIFRVLYAEYAWLKFEGLETKYEGFEFALGDENGTEWHQTKITAPRGNWTVNALKSEGVLSAFKSRLASSQFDTCYFVSEEPAKDAKVLCQKARAASNVSEFEDVLSKDQAGAFVNVCEAWEVDEETAWGWLCRSFFQIESTSELDSNIHVQSQLIFDDAEGAASVFHITGLHGRTFQRRNIY